MIDANLSKPLYEQIHDYLLQGIQSGEFKPGERIPSERELAERFNVSRLTANKAVKVLERAGFVYTQVGKGTFLHLEMHQQQLEHLTGFTDDMRSRGFSASSWVLSAEMIGAPDDIARILNVLPGARLVRLCRVRLADDQPVAVETAHIVAAICPNLLEQHDFSRESLYLVLRRDYNVKLSYAEQTIESRLATKDETAALHIKAGAPILHMTRVAYLTTRQPVEYVQSAYRADRYKFRVVLRDI